MSRPQMLKINQQVLPYLTTKARAFFDLMAAKGYEPDFALALVESTMDEREVFELPAQEETDDNE